MLLPLLSRRRWVSGFSLTEITVALGAISFAILPLIGMLSGGLTLFGETIDQSVSRQIVQRIASDAQQADFGNLTASGNTTARWFDAEGLEVSATDPMRSYEARLQITRPATVPGEGGTPGPEAGTSSVEDLARIAILISFRPAGAAAIPERTITQFTYVTRKE